MGTGVRAAPPAHEAGVSGLAEAEAGLGEAGAAGSAADGDADAVRLALIELWLCFFPDRFLAFASKRHESLFIMNSREVPKSLYQITLWSKIWGELQKKFFFRERAGCGQEGGKNGPLAFIPREMASTRDTFVLKFPENPEHCSDVDIGFLGARRQSSD